MNWPTESPLDTRSSLPVHPVPETARDARGALRVDGLVECPLDLSQAALAVLPRMTLDQPFTCEEGWSVPGLRWTGIRVSEILALARPLPAARYARIASGSYVLPLALSETASAMLCDQLDEQPLSVEHGAPWRLVLVDGVCYASVKWVDRIELTSEPGDNTAQLIARARLTPPT